MSVVETFRYDNSPVRTVVIDDEPWFVAADLAAVLGYRDAYNAARLVDDDEKGTHLVSTPGGQQRVTVISEPGLYVLTMRSDMPDAKRFRRWVTHEVLPAIRRTGRYEVTPTHVIPKSYAEALQLAADQAREIERQAAALAEATPKARSWDVLASGHGDWAVADAAKILSRDPDIELGRNRLYTVLADQRWIYRQQSDGRWRVYQMAIERRWLSELPTSHYHPRTGELVLDPPQVRVTAKGLHELHRRLGGSQPLRLHEQPALPGR